MDFRPLVLKNGKISELPVGDTLQAVFDYHSGISEIDLGVTIVVREKKQMIIFSMGTLDGDITLDGDLWLA